ncbi:nascent polypeptide-associated complex subunit alpha, muscle-specific form-like isoform X2 [Penaeus monodon]|uniref:nascent polypeptide-associated complex subunit alpha, muscle-specific form-like isoform X2 n=1 Tax=Penaeus monodon TaxID=6687 RepID=UPI0018A74CC7|nr:nascent polypeptide-associated complex subunit alpha, muscle-specific form-like isoform X2 [Penaeus monodon]
MSFSRLKLRDPRELLAQPSDPSASVHAMADAATTPATPTTPSTSADQPPALQSPVTQSAPAQPPATELLPAPPAARAPLPPQSPPGPPEAPPDAPPSAASERRDAEPVPKKRRLLEASEAADAQETSAPAKPLSDPQDILAKACFAVGIDSDFAESVVEDPLPPPQQGSQLPPQPQAEGVHYVQGLRPPYPGVPADVRLRPPEVRLHPGMPHPASVNGSYPIAEARVQYHQFPGRFHEPPFPLPRRVPVHGEPRHCLPGPPQPRYQYVAYPRGVPPPRTILVSERVPPPHHAVMHHDPRRPRPPAGQHEPRAPPPAAMHHAPRHPSPPALQHDPRLPPPEYRHAPRMVPEARHMAPMQPEVRYRVPMNHHEVALVASGGPASFVPADGSRPGPPRPKLERQPLAEQRPHPYEMYTPPPGSAHSPKEAPYAPVSPHALPANAHYGPPRVVDRYNKHPYGRAEMSRESGSWHEQATPPPQHSPEDRPRPPEPVRSPYASPQEGSWPAKRYSESQDQASEFIPPQRLREPKPCVELIPLRLPANQEKERKIGGEGNPVPSSPGPPQKHQAATPISPATVTPVNRKASEKGAPAEKYARINTPDDDEIQEASQGNGGLQFPPGLTVTEAVASPPAHHTAAAKRENSKDVFVYPEKSDESAKRLYSDSDKAGIAQAHAELQKTSEDSTELKSKPPEPQENSKENTPKSAAASELTVSKDETLDMKQDRVAASKRQAENGELHPEKEEGLHHRGLPSDSRVLEQYYSLQSSHCVSQGRSASEPPPGAAGPSVNLTSAMRPASLPAATQISVSNPPPNRDSAPPDNLKMNGRAKISAEDNHDNDEVFVERLRFVLDDLVSVPEATLPKASRSPQQVLAYLVRQGGAKPSEHPCLRERLREDFLTMVKRYMPGSTIADWGWDSCSPEQILDQLIKVSSGGDEGINGGARSTSTASAMQDDPLEDDVFTSSDGPQGPRAAPVPSAPPRPSPLMPPAHTAAPTTTSPHTPTPPSTSSSQSSAPCTVTAGAGKPREEVPQSSVPRSPVPQSTVPPTPTPVTSPSAAPTFHAYSANAAYQHTSPTQTSPRAPTSHAAFPHTTPANTKTQHVLSHTMAPHTYPVHATAVHVSTSSPATLYTSNADPTAQHVSTTLTNVTHPHSNNARVMNASTGSTTAPHVSSAHTNASLAYPNHTTAAQALTTYTTIPHPLPTTMSHSLPTTMSHSLPTTTQALHSPAIYSAAQHMHHLQRSASATVTPDAYPDDKRHPASRSVVPQPVTSVPYSPSSGPSVPQSSASHPVSSAPHSSSSAAVLWPCGPSFCCTRPSLYPLGSSFHPFRSSPRPISPSFCSPTPSPCPLGPSLSALRPSRLLHPPPRPSSAPSRLLGRPALLVPRPSPLPRRPRFAANDAVPRRPIPTHRRPPAPMRHPGHPHLPPAYQAYNHHAPVHHPGGRVPHPSAHSAGVHPPPVLMPAGQGAHYPRQPHHLAYHHRPAPRPRPLSSTRSRRCIPQRSGRVSVSRTW